MDLEKNKCTYCLLHETRKSPKMTSCGPSNFEGDKLHLDLLRKPPIFGSSSFVIHITYHDKVANFCGMTKMVMKQKKTNHKFL